HPRLHARSELDARTNVCSWTGFCTAQGAQRHATQTKIASLRIGSATDRVDLLDQRAFTLRHGVEIYPLFSSIFQIPVVQRFRHVAQRLRRAVGNMLVAVDPWREIFRLDVQRGEALRQLRVALRGAPRLFRDLLGIGRHTRVGCILSSGTREPGVDRFDEGGALTRLLKLAATAGTESERTQQSATDPGGATQTGSPRPLRAATISRTS